MSFPYSYFRCPCADSSNSEDAAGKLEEVVEQEDSFDPHAQRSKFSLYPLEHLMWCEDCHDIRCPRCVIEEIVCWYCPSCLFEVASSMVKAEGNRCTRNCFSCPSCTAPLAVNSLDLQTGAVAGPWILACEYCNWTTLDIGIQFEKPNNIFVQLFKILSGRQGRFQSKRAIEIDAESASNDSSDATPPQISPDFQFTNLLAFYKSELSNFNSNDPLMSPTGDLNFNSPSSLQRIMSIYTNQSTYCKKSSTKVMSMGESIGNSEGLLSIDRAMEDDTIEKLRVLGLGGTTNMEQRTNQVHEARFIEGLRPVPTLLRTKRSRRCRNCRHILVKPEPKVTNIRYRIKLVALNYVPSMTIKPLSSSSTAGFDLTALPPSRPLQLLLTLKNPMFDPVKVTLATSTQTPGRFGSRVTILCPQFEIGANTDVWNEALGDGRRSSRLVGKGAKSEESNEAKTAEAGKIWEKGRNWTTIVVEVVCPRIECPENQLEEDEDTLEVPIFVRLEYEAETAGDAGGTTGEREKKEKREPAYWAVLGVGKIARTVTATVAR